MLFRSLERDPEVLRDIGRRFGGRLALDADVVRGGTVRMGDDVVLDVPTTHRGRHVSAVEQSDRVN